MSQIQALLLLSGFFKPSLGLVANCSCSIVIVHGLQGHPYKTWACKDNYRDVPSAARLSVEALNHGNSNQKSYHHVVPRLSWKSSGSSSIGPDPSQRHSGMSRDGGDEKESRVFWPKDLLPARYPNARVLVYGYDTRVTNYLSGLQTKTPSTPMARTSSPHSQHPASLTLH